jgi:tRNA(Ile2) C34 agmatinyltransferase TiaS
MLHRGEFDEEWEDEAELEEDNAVEALDDGDEPTVSCPYCRERIHEDAQRCPHCGTYISEEDRPIAPKPWWLLAGVVVCLYLVYRWTIG